jgi:hypothetical protein
MPMPLVTAMSYTDNMSKEITEIAAPPTEEVSTFGNFLQCIHPCQRHKIVAQAQFDRVPLRFPKSEQLAELLDVQFWLHWLPC